MDPTQYHQPEYSNSTYGDLGPLQLHMANFSEQYESFDQYPQHPVPPPNYFLDTHPVQHTTLYGPTGGLPMRSHSHQIPVHDAHGPLRNYHPSTMEVIPVPPERTHPSHAEKETQTTQSDTVGEGKREIAQERAPTQQRQISRDLVLQVTYKPARQTGFPGAEAIDFVVDGQEGVRLSDALEDKWTGFKGRDDRSLFESGRLQIIMRLHPKGCSPWQNKIHTTDFTAVRRPISRTRLVIEVAKRLKKFIEREKLNGHDASHSDCRLGDVSLKNVFLTRIVRVSLASWQPEIFIERPSGSPQAEVPS